MSWLKDRIRELTVTKRLRLVRGAVITINSGTASESDISIAEQAVLDGVTAGTVTANKAVVVGANKNVDTLAIADGGLKLGAGAGTAVNATAAEINAAADISARIVNTTATTLAITSALHSGRVVTVNSAAPIAITLPASTGGGDIYSFIVGTAATATAHTIKVANTTDIMAGVQVIAQTDTAQVNGFLTTATDDTISLNGTTKGGKVGDCIVITDVAAGVFAVQAVCGSSGTVVTPFSATV